MVPETDQRESKTSCSEVKRRPRSPFVLVAIFAVEFLMDPGTTSIRMLGYGAGFAEFLAARFSVIFAVDLFQVTVGDVRIDLCGVDRGVTEELLDGTDVGAVA